MMDENQSMAISFPIQDAFFISQNDSEIQEIDEIELTPQIQIQEGEGEVSISGYLLLKGKYVAKSDATTSPFFEGEDMERNSYSDAIRFSPFNISQSDFMKEPPLVSFEHRIPVHVQIARSRVENLQHIFASIDSFDYDIVSPQKLAITAELSLNGIKKDDFSAGEQQEIPHAYQYISSDRNPFEMEKEPEADFTPEPVFMTEKASDFMESESTFIQNTEQDVEFTAESKAESSVESNARVSISGKGTKLEPVTVESRMEQREIAPIEEEAIPAEEVDEGQREEAKKEGALYLTGFLRSTEENFTRLKMCILQKDETIDTIAQRYNLSPDEIVRANNEKVGTSFLAGQVIYIPMKKRT